MDNKISVAVNQIPISVSYFCPICGNDIKIAYSQFVRNIGEFCDWNYSKINCDKCKKELEVRIDGSEWD